jgi:ribosomal protein S17
MEDLLRNAVEELKTSFSGPENTQELLTRVKNIVPFKENGFKTINVQGGPGQFKATIKTTFRDEKDIEMFVRNYEIKNNETLRISKSRKASGKGEYTLVKYFRCHHHTRYEGTKCPAQVLASKPSKRFKNTHCPFLLVVRLGKTQDTDFNSTVDIEWNHNHSVDSLHSLHSLRRGMGFSTDT